MAVVATGVTAQLPPPNAPQGAVSGSVQATDRLMKELRDIYRSPSFKGGKCCGQLQQAPLLCSSCQRFSRCPGWHLTSLGWSLCSWGEVSGLQWLLL